MVIKIGNEATGYISYVIDMIVCGLIVFVQLYNQVDKILNI